MYGRFDVVINCARPHWSQFNEKQIATIEQGLLSELNQFAASNALKIHTSGVWLFGCADQSDLLEFNLKPFDNVKLDVRTIKSVLSTNWHIVYCPSIIYGGESCQLQRILKENIDSTIEVAVPSTGYNQYVHVLDVASYYLYLSQHTDIEERQHFIAESKGYSPRHFSELLIAKRMIEKSLEVSWLEYEAKHGALATDVEKLNLNLPISRYFSPQYKIEDYLKHSQ